MPKQLQETHSEKFESGIPGNWAIARFDDVVYVTDYVANGSFASLKKNVTYLDEPDYAILVRFTDHVKGWNGKYKYVDEHAYNFLRKSSVEPGDVVIANVGDPGKLFIVPNLGVPMTLGPNSVLVRPLDKEFLATKYLAFFYQSAWGKDLIAQITTGTAQQKFNKTGLRSTYIPIAPPEQQKRIVAKIEELFSHIDAGIEALKKAKQLLKQYRQSILKAAVTGELTKEWREANKGKLEPASDVHGSTSAAVAGREGAAQLLERILKERRQKWEKQQLEQFKVKGKMPKDGKWKEKYKEPEGAVLDDLPEIPSEWAWATLPQLGELNRGKSKHRPRNDSSLYGGDYPFVQTGDVRAANTWLKEYSQTYSEKGLAQSRLWPKGTMCITIAANIADTAILELDACFPDSVVGFIPLNDSVNIEVVEFFIRTVKSDLEKYAPATAQKNINLAILETVAIPLLPEAEQKELINSLKYKMSMADRLEEEINHQLIKTEKNKQSILSSAFSGNITG